MSVLSVSVLDFVPQAVADAEMFSAAVDQMRAWHDAEMVRVQGLADANAARAAEVLALAKVGLLHLFVTSTVFVTSILCVSLVQSCVVQYSLYGQGGEPAL